MTNSDLPTESGEPRATAATTTTAGSPTELPLAIGRYRVVRLLGTGGFGTVYLTQDTELERLVAVKVPHPERLAKSGDEERYIVEARTVASLDHPAIVPVYDVVRNDEHRIFVVSKFIEGSDLAHWLKQRRPGPRRAAQWIITVAEALHYVATGGRIVLAGVKGFKSVPDFLSDLIVVKEITIKGAFGVTGRAYESAIRLIESGRLPLEKMHTHDFRLEQAEEAIQTLAGARPGEASIHSCLLPGC